MSRILYVTDLAYQARGRRYCDEDIFLTARLREDFDLALCDPRDAAALMDAFDAVVVRNSGPVLTYQEAYGGFRERALATGARVYNPLSGKADMAGKQYLPDLYAAGYPVIPTVDRADDLHRLPRTDRYVVKPRLGADSMGLEIVGGDRVRDLVGEDVLVQPCIDFVHEVSFYFVDHAFQYALYAPHTDRRWQLEPYEPTGADLEFARRFVEWNALGHGIQRVDACRAPGGELLLVELEDLNPYLSLDALSDDGRDAFVAAMKASLHGFLAA
ncbi:hypothetical protein [Streptomyces sp. S.PB5]|uniref:hypothetical protein n=1 Tax=Streptomyces sp. S.PB5 TaxID=3020844 RepID=UPI0025B0F207|nr:hypothetical protein [Streptomyces sp. S.PB5]MDN3027386.1 hypothetical protein [Streptomyces sp. S.PB5]